MVDLVEAAWAPAWRTLAVLLKPQTAALDEIAGVLEQSDLAALMRSQT